MTNRNIVMKEAKAGRCLELEGFLKMYPEKEGWKNCNFKLTFDLYNYWIIIVLSSATQEVTAKIAFEDSVIIKAELKKTGAIVEFYEQRIRGLTNEIHEAGKILLA